MTVDPLPAGRLPQPVPGLHREPGGPADAGWREEAGHPGPALQGDPGES